MYRPQNVRAGCAGIFGMGRVFWVRPVTSRYADSDRISAKQLRFKDDSMSSNDAWRDGGNAWSEGSDESARQFSFPPNQQVNQPGQYGAYNQQPYGQQAYGQQAYAQQEQFYGQHNGYGFDPNYSAGPISTRSRLVAGLLGIFLGGMGIHRFYLGNIGIGVVQIIVTLVTFGLGSIWGFVEGIMILARAKSFSADADGLPLAN